MERRNLVRLLIVLAIGIPILIEVATFGGLFGDRVIGDGGATETPTPEPTPSADAVGVGDELLPTTAQADTVTGAEVRTVDGERTFLLTVAIENTDESSYELRLDALTTDAGTTVTGGGRSEQIPPGGNTTVRGAWTLPRGESPRTVIVVATLTDEGGERKTVTRRVNLAVG